MLTTTAEWLDILAKWNSAARTGDISVELRAREWLGHPPATQTDFNNFDARFHAPLPPSYKAFLSTSNGWQYVSHAVPILRPLATVDWFRTKNRQWITAYTQPLTHAPLSLPPEETYFTYTAEVAQDFRPDHFRHTLQISEIGDSAVFLLNPQVVHPDGEWEAWFLANWLPGIYRYRSFADLMLQHYHELIRDPLHKPDPTPIPLDKLPTVFKDPPGRDPRRVEKRKPRRPLEQLHQIAQDHSPRTKMSARVTAVDELAARRDSSSIPILRKLLHDPLPDVAAAAMKALGERRSVESVPDLIALVEAENEFYWCAIWALGAIGNNPARDFLLSYLNRRGLNASAAAAALAQSHDPRGATAVLAIMLDPNDKLTGNIAGRLAAAFGEAAVEGLCASSAHENAEIRRRAIVGLGDLILHHLKASFGRRAAEKLAERQQIEIDPHVRSLIDILLKM